MKNARGVWKSSNVRIESFSLFYFLIAGFRGELVRWCFVTFFLLGDWRGGKM